MEWGGGRAREVTRSGDITLVCLLGLDWFDLVAMEFSRVSCLILTRSNHCCVWAIGQDK